jgi:hypothetical protein
MLHLRQACFASLAALTFALPLVACSSTTSAACAPEGTISVQVQNQDDVTSNFVCNATVTITATSGGSPQTLKAQGFDGSNANCIYTVNVPAGSYVLHATATGYEMGSESVVTTCVNASPSVQIQLIADNATTLDGGAVDEDGGDDASVFRHDATDEPDAK